MGLICKYLNIGPILKDLTQRMQVFNLIYGETMGKAGGKDKWKNTYRMVNTNKKNQISYQNPRLSTAEKGSTR